MYEIYIQDKILNDYLTFKYMFQFDDFKIY